jgi:DNA polymerase III alpha subunit (gram-positive type)
MSTNKTYTHGYGYSNGQFTEGDKVRIEGQQGSCKIVEVNNSDRILVAPLQGNKILNDQKFQVTENQVSVEKSAPVKNLVEKESKLESAQHSFEEVKNQAEKKLTETVKTSKEKAQQASDKMQKKLSKADDKAKKKLKLGKAKIKKLKKRDYNLVQVNGKASKFKEGEPLTVQIGNKKTGFMLRNVKVKDGKFESKLKVFGKGPWQMRVTTPDLKIFDKRKFKA